MKQTRSDSLFATDNMPLNLTELMIWGNRSQKIMASGAIFLFLGGGVLLLPVRTTVEMSYSFGFLFLGAGLVLLREVIEFRRERGSGIRLFQSILALSLATLMFRYPESGMIGISLALGFYFLSSAALKWILYSVVRAHEGWSWGLLSALVSLVLAGLMLFPFSSFLIPKLLLATELIFSGLGMIGFVLGVRKSLETSWHRPPLIRPLAFHLNKDSYSRSTRSHMEVKP